MHKVSFLPGIVAPGLSININHVCEYLHLLSGGRGWGRRITCAHKFETSLRNIMSPRLKKNPVCFSYYFLCLKMISHLSPLLNVQRGEKLPGMLCVSNIVAYSLQWGWAKLPSKGRKRLYREGEEFAYLEEFGGSVIVLFQMAVQMWVWLCLSGQQHRRNWTSWIPGQWGMLFCKHFPAGHDTHWDNFCIWWRYGLKDFLYMNMQLF